MEERIQVHHNYISAISNHEHKKDLINRLKRSDPHNIPAYEAEMTCHMIMHGDVLGRILTILKQDDYYRTLEELPVIDGLTSYDDIQLFPKLYDTTTIIERVTGEADLIERQLRQPGMYPLPKTPLPSTSGFVPRPTPHFSPLYQIHHQRQSIHTIHTTHKTLKHHQRVHYPVDNGFPWDQQALTAHHLNTHHHSRLYLHNLLHHSHINNTPPHTQPQKTPQSSTTTQPKQQSPIGTNTNPATQPSIPAAETHQPVSSSPPQHVLKSANGEGVKSSKPESRSCAPDG